MNRFSLTLLAFLLLAFSCNDRLVTTIDDTLVSVTPASSFFLEMDLTNVDYYQTGEVDSAHVYALQSTETSLHFTDYAAESDWHSLYYFHSETTPDSVALVGRLQFLSEEETVYLTDTYELAFVLKEARANLEENSDGSFRYSDLDYLASRISEEDWGQNGFRDWGKQQLLLSAVEIEGQEEFWNMPALSSNGFYWEDESLEITEVQYNSADDSIVIAGNFEVQLKVLSCGFFPFFTVKNAHFRAVIQ